MQDVFKQYINYLEVERYVSPYTVRNYTTDLLGNYSRGVGKGFIQFLSLKGICTMEDVDKHTLRDYIAWLMEKDIAKASIARRLSAVRSFYKYLLREEILTSNPMEKASSPKADKRLPEFLTTEEVKCLLEVPDSNIPRGQRDCAWLELLYASGLRVSELVRLNVEHINLDSCEIRVWGKGDKERIVLIGKPAVKALNTYFAQGRLELLGKRKSNAVFLNRFGRRLMERGIQKLLDKYGKAASINKKVHPHMLRHTFATHMLDGGADLRVVQELLGHTKLSSTQIYTHVSKKQARKIYLSAHPMAMKEYDEPSK
ncbi:site-specific tyrosine recombinase/integron integrase [Chloroflexota bacterium]